MHYLKFFLKKSVNNCIFLSVAVNVSLLYTLLSVIRIDRTDDVSQFLEPFILLYFLERLRDQKIAVLSGQTEN